MENIIIPPYIVPIFQFGNFCGTGFIVDDTLFTAQHVALGRNKDGQSISALVNGKTYSLPASAALLSDCDIDTMAFRLNDIGFESPLHFSSNPPVYTDYHNPQILYNSMHYQPLVDNQGVKVVYRESFCAISREENGLYWMGYNDLLTEEGASGSPLIKDNLVYGMLVKAHNKTKYDYLLMDKNISEGMSVEQAYWEFNALANTALYVKGCKIKDVYERSLKHNGDRIILTCE